MVGDLRVLLPSILIIPLRELKIVPVAHICGMHDGNLKKKNKQTKKKNNVGLEGKVRMKILPLSIP